MIPTLRARGRGRRYGVVRGLSELALRWIYRGAWPARAWGILPGRTRVARLHHTLAVLPAGTPPLRIAYASDLHIGPTTPPKLLRRAAELLAEAKPDLLLLGGDYVFLEATDGVTAELQRWVESVPARWKLAVLGNHDLWTWHARIEAALEAADVRVIINRTFRLPAPYDAVTIVGIDDPWTGEPDVEGTLAACVDAPVRFALVHSPKAAPLLAGRVDAIVCGHTHGGHIAWPNKRPVIAPGRSGKLWPHGRHDVNGTALFVSRGLGGVEIPVRTWAQPDVLVVDLVARA